MGGYEIQVHLLIRGVYCVVSVLCSDGVEERNGTGRVDDKASGRNKKFSELTLYFARLRSHLPAPAPSSPQLQHYTTHLC